MCGVCEKSCVYDACTRVRVFGEWNENGPGLRASSSGMIAIYREPHLRHYR